MMKLKTTLSFSCALTFALLFSAFTLPSSYTDEACGVFALGTQKIDLAKGEKSAVVASRDAVIDAIQAGLSFVGSRDCAGKYEILDIKLRIATDKVDVNYDYDITMIRNMQSMEDYMLTRYFVDARTLYFTQIMVKNAQGETMQIPNLSFTIE